MKQLRFFTGKSEPLDSGDKTTRYVAISSRRPGQSQKIRFSQLSSEEPPDIRSIWVALNKIMKEKLRYQVLYAPGPVLKSAKISYRFRSKRGLIEPLASLNQDGAGSFSNQDVAQYSNSGRKPNSLKQSRWVSGS